MTSLPDDLREFLASGEQLDFDPDESSIGPIKLASLDEVTESVIETFPSLQETIDDPYRPLDGLHQITVCNLIAESEEYDPNGLFCWIPKLSMYGSVDPEHGVIIAFPNTTWSMIAANPVDYLDAQWGLSDLGERMLPWLYFPLKLKDGSVIEPYPSHCPMHDAPIAKNTRSHHPLFETFRNSNVDRWLETSRGNFPFAGVPASESELLGCDRCFAAEQDWVNGIVASIPIRDAKMNSGGFVACPGCGIRFSPKDSQVFSNSTHLTCGQRINVLEADV